MEQKYQDYMLQQLQALLAIDSPSGYTEAVTAYLAEELKKLGLEPQLPVKGGVNACIGGSGNGLMLFAHVDTLGAMVHTILPNGRLKVVPVGGLNANNAETENVTVITRFAGRHEGTFQFPNASTHVNPKVNDSRSFDGGLEVVLDEEVSSAADVKKLGICPGDFVAVEPRTRITKTGYIKSRFLDDKASAAVLLTLAKWVKEEQIALPREVWIGFTVYEEVGHGAAHFMPAGATEAISVDMGCVGNGLQCTETQVSICAKDRGGPYNYEVTTGLIKAAMDNGVDYAVDIYPFYGSDVDVALKSGFDIKHGLIGPGVYASHGYERTHIKGLAATFDLLRAYVK